MRRKNRKIDLKKYVLGIIYVFSFQLFEVKSVFAATGVIDEPFNKFQDKVHTLTDIIVVFALITSVLALICHFIRLGGMQARPFYRKQTIQEIGVTILCICLLGGIGLIAKLLISVFY